MKKITLALLILLFLFSSFLIIPVKLVTANPADLFHFPWDTPITTMPEVIIYSPVENQSYKSILRLNFSVIKPDNWYYGGVRATGVEVFGKVTEVYCELEDGQRFNFTVNDWDSPHGPCNKTSLDFSMNIPLESAGAHRIKVFVQAFTYYVIYSSEFGFCIQNEHLRSESQMQNFFLFHKQPTVSFSSSQTNNYNQSSIPVNFIIDEPITQIQYCLDGTENKTVSGNFTLNGLSNGNHSLIIYAKDYSETIVPSEICYFNVNVVNSFSISILIVSISVVICVLVIIGAFCFVAYKRKQSCILQ